MCTVVEIAAIYRTSEAVEDLGTCVPLRLYGDGAEFTSRMVLQVVCYMSQTDCNSFVLRDYCYVCS